GRVVTHSLRGAMRWGIRLAKPTSDAIPASAPPPMRNPGTELRFRTGSGGGVTGGVGVSPWFAEGFTGLSCAGRPSSFWRCTALLGDPSVLLGGDDRRI